MDVNLTAYYKLSPAFCTRFGPYYMSRRHTETLQAFHWGNPELLHSSLDILTVTEEMQVP